MAPHLPAQPAPWHAHRYPNTSSPDNSTGAVIAPRTLNFNELGIDHSYDDKDVDGHFHCHNHLHHRQ